MMETARQRIAQLVENFQRRKPAELRRMSEAQARQSLIDPLFEVLGWNVRDPDEVSVEVNVARSRVDYAFRLNRITRFIVEAKAPHVDLTQEEFVRQAVTYAYSKGVNWAVLTNFKELRVFSAEESRPFLNLGCQDYFGNFEKLWLLSKPSWESGLFEREATQYGALRPSVPVEKSLFDQLLHWRETLFNQIDGYNKGLSLTQIDELIQQFLNRLIFIRTAEDRGIEEHLLLATLHQWQDGHRGRLLDNLRAIFAEFAQRYDSDLFPILDSWASVFVDDPTLEAILQGLYQRPRSLAGYDFAAIDPDVLGAVYEQYLGHVAEAVKERVRQAERQLRLLGKGEDLDYELTAKKQKRKSQGIYYTPKWVVDYIVRQTVGRFLEERSYNEVFNMKILDPACGSGSFLIRAYDELLAYHARIQGKTPADLGWAERISILTRNIFGVDLDDQAVQIARLNLLLRALAKQELLPGLADNIRRGNSLISGGEAELQPYFGDAWREKRPFNWEQEFPEIMKRGGFDVVIGNPPYVRVDSLPEDDKRFYKGKFLSAVGKYDAYYLFLELGLKLVREGGALAFIVPNRFCTNTTGEDLRRLLLSPGHQVEVTSVSRLPVFREAANYPVITVVRKHSVKPRTLAFVDPGDVSQLPTTAPSYQLSEDQIVSLPRVIMPINVTEVQLAVALRLSKLATPAGKLLEIQEGLRIPRAHETQKDAGLEQVPIIKQFQFSRYSSIKEGSFLTQKNLESLFSQSAKRIVNSRKPKLVFAEDALRVEATMDTSKGLCQGGAYFATLLADKPYSLLYLLGLFNSRLLTFHFKSLYSGIHMGGGFLRFRTEYLQELPIHRIDFDNPGEKAMHERLVALVEQMQELQRRKLDKSLLLSDREDIEREIARTDQEIDNLVYDLYGLTEEERRLVEQT